MARPTLNIEASVTNITVVASTDGIALGTIASGPVTVEGRPIVLALTQDEAAVLIERMIAALGKSVDLGKLHEF